MPDPDANLCITHSPFLDNEFIDSGTKTNKQNYKNSP